MKNIIGLLFSILLFVRVNCQSVAIPEWYLNYLLNSGQCGLSPRPVGLELMWNTTYSREFLLKKLNAKESVHKAKAIVFLGMSKDTSLIDYLEPYAASTDAHIARCAINAIGKIGGSKSAQILEKCWKTTTPDWLMTMEIVRSLELVCSHSSIPIINEIRQKFNVYFDKSEKLRNEFDALVEKIEKFNNSEHSRRQLLLNGLNGLKGLDANEDFCWAYFQIHRSKDKGYLPVLRSMQPALKDLPYLFPDETLPDSFQGRTSNSSYNAILRLRIHLGDELFTDDEQTYLSKTEELFPLEKRMPLIQQEISILEPHYKDKYSKGR